MYGLDPFAVLDEEDEFRLTLLSAALTRAQELDKYRNQDLANKIAKAVLGS